MNDRKTFGADSGPSKKISVPVPAVSNEIRLSEWEAVLNDLVFNIGQVETATRRASAEWPKKNFRMERRFI